MPSVASLIVRIGANDQEIQHALASVGQKAKSVDADLRKLGSSPLAGAAQKSLDSLRATMTQITDAQTRVAERARFAAQGLEAMGGASRLTDSQLKQMHRTLQEGLSAYAALGKEPPAALRRIADETKQAMVTTEGWKTSLKGLAGAIGAAFTVGAIINFGRDLLRMGDDIVRVADRTGLLTDEVQQLSFIAKQSGNSIDELVGAVGQLQNRLASGDDSAVKAVQALGLSFEKLRAAGPYEQLQLIATAISKIPDPAGRAQVAMDLFGRTGIAILPTLTSEFERLGNAAPKMAHNTVVALDQAGDALDKFQLSVKVWAAESYNALSGVFDKFSILVLKTTAAFFDATANILSVPLKIPGASTLFPGYQKSLDEVRERAQFARDAARQLGLGFNTASTEARKSVPIFNALGESLKKIETIQKSTAGRVSGAVTPAAGLQSQSITAIQPQFEGLQGLTKTFVAFGEAAQDGTLYAHNFSYELNAAQIQTDYFGNAINVKLIPSLKGVGTGLAEVESKTQRFKNAMKSSLGGLNNIFQSAFEGGGGTKGALKSLATDLLAKGLEMIPVVGKFISQFAGAITAGFSKLFGKLFGTAGRDAVRDFATTNGGFDALHKRLALLGAEGEKLWIALTQGVGRNNAEQAKAAIEKVTAALDAQKRKFEELQGAVSTTGEKLSGITMITPEIQAALDDVFDENTTEGYLAAVQRLNSELDKQAQKYADIEAALNKYNISFDQAGQQFKQMKLNELAVTLRKDFDNLRASGVDINVQMRSMGLNIRDFIAQAKKGGLEVPESMREIIQVAIDAGEVFDENGNKITDINQLGLKFGVTMQTAMKTVETAISRLNTILEALAKFLGIELPKAAQQGADAINDALGDIADPEVELRVKVPGDLSKVPQEFPTGENSIWYSGTNDSPDSRFRFANGSGGIRDFGAGTLAVLHGREAVVTEADLRSGQAAAMLGTGAAGSGVTINITGPVIAAREFLEREVIDPLMDGIRRYGMTKFSRLVNAVP